MSKEDQYRAALIQYANFTIQICDSNPESLMALSEGFRQAMKDNGFTEGECRQVALDMVQSAIQEVVDSAKEVFGE